MTGPSETPERAPRVRIVSEGTAATTRVLVDGKPLPGVATVQVHRIEPHGVVRASIELVGVELDLAAEAAFFAKPIKEN